MTKFKEQFGFSEEDWKTCINVLETLKNDPHNNPDNEKFGTLITKIKKKSKKDSNNFEKQESSIVIVSIESTIVKNARAGITFFGEETIAFEPTFTTVNQPSRCYICHEGFNKVHSFYHRLCPECATLNFDMRSRKVDLTKRNVIITGGRIKVGYATALRFLRCNAKLVVTTRFPSIAYSLFEKERDFKTWKDNLTIYGLDLRDLKSVDRFITYYNEKNEKLDILINNAAQTIKYDEPYYNKLESAEASLSLRLKASDHILHSGNINKKDTKSTGIILQEELTRFGEPIDFREKNSWNSKLSEIDLIELLEVNLINQISPYLLIKGFMPMLQKSEFTKRFIINVASAEGQFNISKKTEYHPHTNMTKAALNMLTLTSASDLARDGIYMNSVDVGWISTGANETLRRKNFEEGKIPPLDPVDGASRIIHPIYESIIKDNNIFGKLIKDYRFVDW